MFPRLSNLGKAAENGASGLEMAAQAVNGPTQLMTAAVGGVAIGKAASALEGTVGQLLGETGGGSEAQAVVSNGTKVYRVYC
jgi:hypothetical protein